MLSVFTAGEPAYFQNSCLDTVKWILSRAQNDLQTQLREFAEGFIESQPINRGGQYLTTLPNDLIDAVCNYLSLNDIGSLLVSCKHLNQTLHPLLGKTPMFWAKEFGTWCNGTPISFSNYLNQRLQFERDELKHWRTVSPLMSALKKMGSPNIIEISGNVGKFPNRRISRAVTRRRPQALVGAIVRTVTVAQEFRKLTNYRRAVNFMCTETFETGAARPPIEADGFVGYALDLLQLRPEEEYLRETVLASLVYRDLTVWESQSDVERAISSGVYATPYLFYCVLDDERGDREVMDDDAPRNIHGQPQVDPARTTPNAPYFRFRPRMDQIKSIDSYLARLQMRVNALESAVVNCIV